MCGFTVSVIIIYNSYEPCSLKLPSRWYQNKSCLKKITKNVEEKNLAFYVFIAAEREALVNKV
jgi:hypothetical protein